MSCHCDDLCLQQFSSNTTLGPEFLAKQFQLKPRGNTMSFHDPLNESKWAFCDSFTEITMLDTWHKLDQIRQGNVIDEACLDQSQNIWLREYLNLCKLISDTIACFPSMSIISVVWLGINLINFHSAGSPWWCHVMETFSVLLALCAGNSLVTGEFPSQRPVTQSFDFSLICTCANDWVNNQDASYLRCCCTHYDLTVMQISNY